MTCAGTLADQGLGDRTDRRSARGSTRRRSPPILRGRRTAPTSCRRCPASGRRRRSPSRTGSQRGGTVNDASCLGRTAVAGVVRRAGEAEVAAALGLCHCARPHRLGRRSEAFDGRPGVRNGRPRARHARDERDRARSRPAHGHGRRRRDLARHPERDPSALRGQGDAIDRHLHRRRLDLGQRARHGP